MNNAQQLPDLGNSFTKMKIQDQISGSYHSSLFACVCRENVYKDFNGVVEMIQQQLQDNRALVIDMVGETVVVMIEKMKV
jgi:hypothetical protein